MEKKFTIFDEKIALSLNRFLFVLRKEKWKKQMVTEQIKNEKCECEVPF